jgi:hypothetical protein
MLFSAEPVSQRPDASRLSASSLLMRRPGMVGGDIVLQLLLRGQAPESIRIVDFQPVNRADMVETARGCDFVMADMTSPASVEAAFSKPWPASVAKKPLTVYHTAAVINPSDRSERLYERLRRINVDGTANVVEGAKKAGADIFVVTSSASISFPPADLWVWPWQSVPKHYVHIASEADFAAPIRPHDRFFANCEFGVPWVVWCWLDISADDLETANLKRRPSVSFAVRTAKGSEREPSVLAMCMYPLIHCCAWELSPRYQGNAFKPNKSERR